MNLQKQKSFFLHETIALLNSGNFSCVIKTSSGKILTFSQRGIKDLIKLTQNDKQLLKDATIADKVIGKAAAALLILGGVNAVFANIISIPALRLLYKYDICVEYKISVDNIRNRDNTDICPMEKMIGTEDSPADIIVLINSFLTQKSNM